MAFKFVRFDKFGSSFSAKVSIRNNGQIGITQGALKKMGITGDGHSVVLFFDTDAHVIGIKPTSNEKEPGAIKVHVRPAGKDGSVTAHISGKSFLECYEIPYKDKTRSFEPLWNAEHEMFLVDLSREKGSKRKPQKNDPPVDEKGGGDADKFKF